MIGCVCFTIFVALILIGKTRENETRQIPFGLISRNYKMTEEENESDLNKIIYCVASYNLLRRNASSAAYVFSIKTFQSIG